MNTCRLAILAWDSFSILCQGAIAGLIVLGATTWLQRRKEKELTCKNALLVWLELQGNLAEINDILAHNQFPESVLPLSFSTSTWKESQLYLTNLPVDDLKCIGAYYQALPAIDHLVKVYTGQNLTPVMLSSLTQVQAMCVMAQDLLASHWDLKNAEKYRQSFLRRKQQSHHLI
jgi:hypothetical protein